MRPLPLTLVPVEPRLAPAERLERITASARAALEALPARQLLMRPSVTRDEYRQVIERALGFYAPLEQRLGHARAHLPGFDYHARWKTTLLAYDLDVLRQTREAHPPVPRCAMLPEVASPAAALGVWYVLEGATLGNRAVYKHLVEVLGLSPSKGASFLASYGEATLFRWRAFLDDLCARFDTTEIDFDTCAKAALDTCAALQDWFGSLPATLSASADKLREQFAAWPTRSAPQALAEAQDTETPSQERGAHHMRQTTRSKTTKSDLSGYPDVTSPPLT